MKRTEGDSGEGGETSALRLSGCPEPESGEGKTWDGEGGSFSVVSRDVVWGLGGHGDFRISCHFRFFRFYSSFRGWGSLVTLLSAMGELTGVRQRKIMAT